MTNDDLNQIGKLLDEKLIITEKRLRTVIGSDLKTEIVASEKRVITEIVDFVQDQLMPVIDDKADKSDIENATRREDFLSDKVGEHDVRLKNIESIPVVALQLKVKRTK